MDQTEQRIIEKVRKYDHLYNFSSRDYKDYKMTSNSWREITQNTGLEVAECARRWKNLRDKYVRLRKKLATKSGDPGGQKVPAVYHFLSWLAPHVKHCETDSNYESTTCGLSESETASASTPSPTEPPRPVTPGLRATLPPASSLVESPVSWPKRKRDHQDDMLVKDITNLGDRRIALQQKLLEQGDECSRFGQTVAELLQRVPEDKRPDVMYKVYGLIHENRL